MKLNSYIIILSLCIIFLVSCAGPTYLTNEGAQVRQISDEVSNQCNFIGIIFARGYGRTSGEALSDARRKLRNTAAANGGNAFILLDVDKDGWISCLKPVCGANVEAQAYICSK